MVIFKMMKDYFDFNIIDIGVNIGKYLCMFIFYVYRERIIILVLVIYKLCVFF